MDEHYDREVIYAVLFLYFVALLIWLVLIYKIRDRDALAILILIIPIIIMGISILNILIFPNNISDKLFRSNYVSVAVLICVPLLSWINRDISGYRKKKFVFCSILAVIFALIGLYDCWVPCRWYLFIRQFKSISQTFAITLLLYALYSFYLEHSDRVLTPPGHHDTKTQVTDNEGVGESTQ